MAIPIFRQTDVMEQNKHPSYIMPIIPQTLDSRTERPTAIGLDDLSISPLLALNEFGFLPAGIHDAKLDEIEANFARTPTKRELWRRLLWFLAEVTKDHFSYIYLAGGFVTSKEESTDMDVLLQPRASFGPKAFKAMEPFFVTGLDTIHKKYHVHLHFWCDGFPTGMQDFRKLFQSIRSSEARAKRLTDRFQKGIVKIAL